MILASYDRRKHLTQSEIEPPETKCPICGANERRDSQLLIQKDPDILLLRCPRCFGLSASQMPTGNALSAFYGSYYDAGDEQQVIFQNPSRLARHIVSAIGLDDVGAGGIRVIDFGGGDGTISRLTAERIAAQMRTSVHVDVIDFTPRPPSRHGAVDLAFTSDLKNVEGPCDLVIASGVFEHVPNLGSVLEQLAARLRPGGFLYSRTLYGLPLMRLFGMKMRYPAHCHDLGDRFWGTLPGWFKPAVTLVHSRPAIVETDFKQQFFRTALAHCFKAPARIEGLWTRFPLFKLYGGWEVVLRRTAPLSGTA